MFGMLQSALNGQSEAFEYVLIFCLAYLDALQTIVTYFNSGNVFFAASANITFRQRANRWNKNLTDFCVCVCVGGGGEGGTLLFLDHVFMSLK